MREIVPDFFLVHVFSNEDRILQRTVEQIEAQAVKIAPQERIWKECGKPPVCKLSSTSLEPWMSLLRCKIPNVCYKLSSTALMGLSFLAKATCCNGRWNRFELSLVLVSQAVEHV